MVMPQRLRTPKPFNIRFECFRQDERPNHAVIRIHYRPTLSFQTRRHLFASKIATEIRRWIHGNILFSNCVHLCVATSNGKQIAQEAAKHDAMEIQYEEEHRKMEKWNEMSATSLQFIQCQHFAFDCISGICSRQMLAYYSLSIFRGRDGKCMAEMPPAIHWQSFQTAPFRVWMFATHCVLSLTVFAVKKCASRFGDVANEGEPCFQIQKLANTCVRCGMACDFCRLHRQLPLNLSTVN